MNLVYRCASRPEKLLILMEGRRGRACGCMTVTPMPFHHVGEAVRILDRWSEGKGTFGASLITIPVCANVLASANRSSSLIFYGKPMLTYQAEV